MKDPLVVLGSALVVAAVAVSFAACEPYLIVPAEGTSLAYESCGVTSQGVRVVRYEARCPDLMRVEERARRVKARYAGCSLDGVTIHVIGAYVFCAGESVRACVKGSDVTITADAFVIPSIEHELSHVCLSQREGDNGLAHHDLDHRDEALDAILHRDFP